MGWARWLLLGDLGQQMDLADQENQIRRYKRMLAENAKSVESTESTLLELQVENDQLKLCLAAVVRILIDRGLTTAADIKRLVEAIDAEDGTADGRSQRDVV